MATISDMSGNYLTQGLQGCDACDVALQAARKMAASRGEDVLLNDDDGEWIVHPSGECDRTGAVNVRVYQDGNSVALESLAYGSRVYDGSRGEVLRLVGAPGCWQTNDPRGNYRDAMAVVEGGASDVSGSDFAAMLECSRA